MKRRDLLVAAGALAATPLLRAQSQRIRRVAYADAGTASTVGKLLPLFKGRLGELGWSEGRNVEYEYGYANNDPKRYEQVLTELLAQKPDVMFVYWGPMALVAKKLTQDVPIVFAIASGPEQVGLVASLARPGGNVTGAATREREFAPKRVELLKELVPGMRRLAVLANADIPSAYKALSERYGAIAQQAGLQLTMLSARSAEEFAPAMDSAVRAGADAIVGIADVVHFTARSRLAEQLARARLPALYPVEEYVEAGALASYGIDNVDQFRRGAGYVDKILRGAKPADLPVEEPTSFTLAVNLKTARVLGIRIPQSVLLRATSVIE
ncbi:MAG: ABC transporter substrate-binding protein [Betaproteobacteria bacterium]